MSSPPPTKDEVSILEMETREASPSHFLLKVESLSSLGKHGIHKYETGEFDAGGYKWRLNIDFNGEPFAMNGKYISAYLAISDTTSLPANWEVNAVFSIFLMNQISGNYHYSSGTRCFVAVKSEWGFPQFISKKALNDPSNGFLIDNDCVFGVEVFIIRNTAVFQSLLLREACLLNKGKGLRDEKCSCLEFCMLLLDTMKSKACSPVRHLKDQTNDEHEKTEVAILETREASPTHILMKVESFPLLGKHGIYEVASGEFFAGGFTWRLIICPNEDKTGLDSNYISVYLAISDTSSVQSVNWEVNAVFSIFLFNQISGNYHYSSRGTCRFLAMKREWGISKFISKKLVMDPSNGFLIDNNCVFGAEVFVVEKSAVCECLSVKVTDPYKRDWKISNYSKLGNVWTSEQFIAHGLIWEVSIYPKGNDYEEGRCLSAYLRLIDSKRVKASFFICIKDQIYEKHCRKKSSHWYLPKPDSNSGWGSTRFIELATLEDPKNGFIIDDCCLLEIEISVQAVV